MQNGNDPMSVLINSLPAAQQAGGGAGDLFGQDASMFGSDPGQQQPQYQMPPQAAIYAQPAPASQGQGQPQYQQPGQQQQPQYQMPYQQQPLPYQQPVYQQQQQPPAPQHQQPGQQQQPTGPQPEYPMVVPGQMPMQNQEVPAWAAGLTQTVQELQQQVQNQPQGGDDWPDRPKTWGGLKQAIQTEAQKIAQEHIKTYQDQQTTAAQQQEQAMQAANQQIDSALGNLRNGGFLPIVANPTDPNDVGKIAERELIAYAVSTGGQDAQSLLRAAPTLKALHDSGVYFDFTRNTLVRRGSQSAAAGAPIAGASPSFGNAGGGQQAAPTNRQIANMSMDQLMAMGMTLNQ